MSKNVDGASPTEALGKQKVEYVIEHRDDMKEWSVFDDPLSRPARGTKYLVEINAGRAGSAVERIVMFMQRITWKISAWLFARLVVILAIAFAVQWGGIFQGPLDIFKAVLSWGAIWAAIEYFRWHVARFET
jgi:hypothetical protein